MEGLSEAVEARTERRELREARSEEGKARGGRAEHRRWPRGSGDPGGAAAEDRRRSRRCPGEEEEEEEVHRYAGEAKEEGGRLLEEAGPKEKPNPRRERL